MSKPIFLYPSLNEELKEGVFQAKKYAIYYVNHNGCEKELEYEPADVGTSVNCLKTDGVWNADNFNLCIKRALHSGDSENCLAPMVSLAEMPYLAYL